MVTGGVEAGRALVENPITKMVTMTGGTPTGQAIARTAAQNLMHVQLELGGKAPCIVFEDADIEIKTFNEVITYANDSAFGLAAMVFTNGMNKIMRWHYELEFGEIYINRGHGAQHQGFHNGLKLIDSRGEDGKYVLEQYLEKKRTYIKYQA